MTFYYRRSNRTGLCLTVCFLILQAKMTATDGLLEPKKAFSIREMKNTQTFRERETACVVLGYVLNY